MFNDIKIKKKWHQTGSLLKKNSNNEKKWKIESSFGFPPRNKTKKKSIFFEMNLQLHLWLSDEI